MARREAERAGRRAIADWLTAGGTMWQALERRLSALAPD
jgi:hypothetical protein